MDMTDDCMHAKMFDKYVHALERDKDVDLRPFWIEYSNTIHYNDYKGYYAGIVRVKCTCGKRYTYKYTSTGYVSELHDGFIHFHRD